MAICPEHYSRPSIIRTAVDSPVRKPRRITEFSDVGHVPREVRRHFNQVAPRLPYFLSLAQSCSCQPRLQTRVPYEKLIM